MLVLRLVVVPLLTLGAAQRNPLSPHYLLLPVGLWAPLALLLWPAALLQLSSCYRPTDFVLLLLPATLPSCPAPRAWSGVATESSYVQGFGFSLSRSVPVHGVAEGEGKVESVLLHNLRHHPRPHRASSLTDGKA